MKLLTVFNCPKKIGVCLDTCHVWDAGYDIAGHLDEVLTQFDRVIGLSKLKAIHLNNTKNPFEHEKIAMLRLQPDKSH